MLIGFRHLFAPPITQKDTPMVHFLWMSVVGIIVSTMTRWIMPGSHHLSLLMTDVLGIAGSLLGGLMARLFSKPANGAAFNLVGIMLSVIGAWLLLYEWHFFAG